MNGVAAQLLHYASFMEPSKLCLNLLTLLLRRSLTLAIVEKGCKDERLLAVLTADHRISVQLAQPEAFFLILL